MAKADGHRPVSGDSTAVEIWRGARRGPIKSRHRGCRLLRSLASISKEAVSLVRNVEFRL